MPNEKSRYLLSHAEEVAKIITGKLQPFCKKIEIAGSIRRRVSWVHDIDIVLIPGNAWDLYHAILALTKPYKPDKDGPKIKSFRYAGIPIDLYIADEKEWATLLLIRTGSAKHNIKLCTRAKDIGFKLKADGSGLFNQADQRIAGDTEESIFEALGIPFKKPEERR